MATRFQSGDRIRLARPYWVNRPGDCAKDVAARKLVVGQAVGKVEDYYQYGSRNEVEVWWDDLESKRHPLLVNEACLELEAPLVSDEEIAQAINSITQVSPTRVTPVRQPTDQEVEIARLKALLDANGIEY